MSDMLSGTVSADDYVDAQGDSTRCVDERVDKDGKNLGVQMPGGSEHIMDLLMVAIMQSDEEVTDEELFVMTEAVYDSDTAADYDLVPGVHIDDEHGHLDMDACEERDAGCGYDKVRTQVLRTLYGYELDYAPGERIQAARDMGWGVQVLTGDHRDPGKDETVTAAINYVTGTTLDTAVLWEEGRVPSYNHDIWVVETMLPVMVEQLREAELEDAADLLEEHAMQWSEDIYGETLNVLSGGVLTGDDLVEIR